MPKIEKITAFVSVDAEGNEGILGEKVGNTWIPLIAADLERLHSLLGPAVRHFKARGINFKIIEFSVRTDVTQQHLDHIESLQKDPGKLSHFVVYDHPSDAPEHYVVRQWRLKDGFRAMIPDDRFEMRSNDLSLIHAELLSMGLYRTAPGPEDDPVIIEVWM